MRNILRTPDIKDGFTHFSHIGGTCIEPNIKLIELQEILIREGFVLTGERRQEFMNLEDRPENDLQQTLQAVLESVKNDVLIALSQVTVAPISIDERLSAVWIEKASDSSNCKTHRDASDPKILRATFSVSPTRILPPDIQVPISEEYWNAYHYPSGEIFMPELDPLTTRSTDGNIQIMTGTTYHRAPYPNEIQKDFQELFGSCLKTHPRIFGSIWGTIA